MKPLISVIVPVYKVQAYLEQCVQSILSQTYKELQVVLVDDGSPDNCGEMCDGLAHTDARIQVIHKSNGGLSDARNAGIAQAKGDYFAFIDSDDWVANEYIEYLYRGIECGGDISVCNFFTVRGKNEIPWRKPSDVFSVMSSMEAVKNMLYAESFDTSAWGKLFPRACFDEIEFPRGMLYEEVATTYRLLLTQKTVSVGRKPLYYYRMRAESIVNSAFDIRCMDMLTNTQRIYVYAAEKAPELNKAAERKLVYACFYILKTIGNQYAEYPEITEELVSIVRGHGKSVLEDSRASMRDKAAIILLSLGVKPFVSAWNCYCAMTGRNILD